MPLNDLKVKGAKAGAKPYKLADERGLYLLIQPSGSKLWRFDYRHAGKRKTLALGTYPDTPLSGARKRLGEARAQLEDGIDPSAARQAAKAEHVAKTENSFEAIAREWFAKFSPGWKLSHAEKIIRRLERDVFPWIGAQPIAGITAPQLLTVLRRLEARGVLETAHRAHQNCGQVFRYAVATGRAERDPSGDLRGALAPWKPQHMASITDPKEIGALLRAIDSYKGVFVTRCAMQMAPLVFVRPGELRQAEWSEINFDTREWRIPAEKMKAGVLHIVPLSDQAIAILRELHPLTGAGRYVFAGVRDRPMSENTVLYGLRRLGYAEMTGHGFRSMASTLLNEQGWPRDVIERQLAHGERDKVRAAYNYAEHMPERRKMMQAWADYLDVQREGRKVVGGKFGLAA